MTTILIADDHPLFREALRGVALRLLPGAHIRKIAENAPEQLGDISTLADPSVVESLVNERQVR